MNSFTSQNLIQLVMIVKAAKEIFTYWYQSVLFYKVRFYPFHFNNKVKNLQHSLCQFSRQQTGDLSFSYFPQENALTFHANCLLKRKNKENYFKMSHAKIPSMLSSVNSLPAGGNFCPLPSADNICKQFGPRSGQTNRWA